MKISTAGLLLTGTAWAVTAARSDPITARQVHPRSRSLGLGLVDVCAAVDIDLQILGVVPANEGEWSCRRFDLSLPLRRYSTFQ